MNKLLISNKNDPYYNIALERCLFKNAADDDIILYLWQNSPCVVVGRNQNILLECDTDYMTKTGILPLRRFSGGGAVFQDLGNLNYTFIANEKYADDEKFKLVLKKVTGDLNVNSVFTGRNDIHCQGKKFSGYAYLSEDQNYMYHGTMMIDVDLDMLTQVLSPSILKIQAKGIESVKSRVINLQQINKTITVENTIKLFGKAFEQVYGPYQVIDYQGQDLDDTYSLLSSSRWIYGQCPAYTLSLEKKLKNALVTLNLEVTDGVISRVKVYTDSLEPDFADKCEKILLNSLFEPKNILFRLESLI